MNTPLLRKWLLSTCLAAMATFSAQAQYCTPSYGTGCSADDDINDFSITGAATSSISDLATGCSPNGYRNMSATMSVTLEEGGAYVAFISTTLYNENVEVFIDFNNDNSFSPNESVGGANYVDDFGTNMNISIPNGAPIGSHRMRVVLSYDFLYPGISACPNVAQGYEYGEVHDYTANIIPGPGQTCTPPLSLSASATTNTTSSLIWAPVTGALGYEYIIDQVSGTPSGAGTFTTATTMLANGLTANLVYYLHMRTKCSPTTFSPWTELEFVTNYSNTCIAPGGFTTTAISNNAATLTWATVPGTQGYEIFVSDVQLVPLNGQMIGTNGVQYNNLDPNVTYYAWLRQHCSSTSQSEWAVMAFTTTNNYTPGSGISGNIYVGDTVLQTADTYKVWLINYNATTTTLTAVDSLITSTASYAFTNPPTGTYLIKAAQLNGIPGTVGQMPTYHDSSLYWNTALQVTANGTSSYVSDIWMREGQVTAGPGFIGGNVSLGANKGTASGVAGMMIVLRNANGKLVKGTYTDASGNFTFTNLPTGNYSVYPEQLGYATTVATVNITSGQPNIANINFNQDDAQKNIKPRPTGISNVNNTNATVSLMPNPASNVLNLSWSGYENEKELLLTITNSTGQTVLNQTLQTGRQTTARVDVSALAQGVYFVRLSGATGQVVHKLVVQR